jgi:hypothetical protein
MSKGSISAGSASFLLVSYPRNSMYFVAIKMGRRRRCSFGLYDSDRVLVRALKNADGAASNDPPLVAMMIAGAVEGCGPSQPLPAVSQHHLPTRTGRGDGPREKGAGRHKKAEALNWIGLVRDFSGLRRAPCNPSSFALRQRDSRRRRRAGAPQGIGQQWRPFQFASLPASQRRPFLCVLRPLGWYFL